MVRDTQHNVEETWQIDRNHLAAWRSWNGEVVVYDDFSGDKKTTGTPKKWDLMANKTF